MHLDIHDKQSNINQFDAMGYENKDKDESGDKSDNGEAPDIDRE